MNPTTDPATTGGTIYMVDDGGELHQVHDIDSLFAQTYTPPRRDRRPGSGVSAQLGYGDDPRTMRRRRRQRLHWRERG